MKISSDELIRWRYYFFDLPKWAFGVRSRALQKTLPTIFENEIASIQGGLVALNNLCGKSWRDRDIESALSKAMLVKLVRESDGYSALRMTRKNFHRFFRIDGIENLYSSIQAKRFTIILTGHIGSFFTPPIAFSHLNIAVHPIAAVVTHPVPSTRHFLSLYRYMMRKACSTPFIYTDMHGKIERSIMRVFKEHGVLWAAIDTSRHQSAARRLPVRFLGQASSLPSGLVEWGLKKNAVFLTAWNTIQMGDNMRVIRNLKIDTPIDEGLVAQDILQTYADRLSEILCKEPWQWMQLNILRDYLEELQA